MAKIKLTKNELKKQKDALKMFRRYLPTLQLKKQQLQAEIRGIEARARALAEERDRLDAEFVAWIAVFGETSAMRSADGGWLLKVRSVRTRSGNIAGVEIPVFEGADFALEDYDLFVRPLWIDKALERLRAMLLLDLEIKVLDEQVARLARTRPGIAGLRLYMHRANQRARRAYTQLGMKHSGYEVFEMDFVLSGRGTAAPDAPAQTPPVD